MTCHQLNLFYSPIKSKLSSPFLFLLSPPRKFGQISVKRGKQRIPGWRIYGVCKNLGERGCEYPVSYLPPDQTCVCSYILELFIVLYVGEIWALILCGEGGIRCPLLHLPWCNLCKFSLQRWISNLPDCRDVTGIIISEEYRGISNDWTTGSYPNRINTGNFFPGGILVGYLRFRVSWLNIICTTF